MYSTGSRACNVVKILMGYIYWDSTRSEDFEKKLRMFFVLSCEYVMIHKLYRILRHTSAVHCLLFMLNTGHPTTSKGIPELILPSGATTPVPGVAAIQNTVPEEHRGAHTFECSLFWQVRGSRKRQINLWYVFIVISLPYLLNAAVCLRIFIYKGPKTKLGSVCRADRAQTNGSILRPLANFHIELEQFCCSLTAA